jgi:hypothetical protein
MHDCSTTNSLHNLTSVDCGDHSYSTIDCQTRLSLRDGLNGHDLVPIARCGRIFFDVVVLDRLAAGERLDLGG